MTNNREELKDEILAHCGFNQKENEYFISPKNLDKLVINIDTLYTARFNTGEKSMDAKLWAKEFVKKFNKLEWMVDEGLMLGWFANAIMAGYDEAMRRADARFNKAVGEDEQVKYSDILGTTTYAESKIRNALRAKIRKKMG